MRKAFITKLTVLCFSVILLLLVQCILVPKYQGNVVEGNFTSEYYAEELPHQLLILGDCEAYENISPAVLWKEYGITSYIRGNANQLPSQSYYLLEEALRYEKPSAVLFSVSALQESGQVKESYNRMVFDDMKWSSVKWNAIRASMLPEEHMIEYIFPILRFHERWKALEKADFIYMLSRPLNAHNGYYLRADIRAAEEFPQPRRLADPMLPEVSMLYLDRIRDLCRQEGIELVLFKAPSLYPVWHEEWEMQVRDYAESSGLLYINCLEDAERVGIDYTRDTYDGGMHMNVYGAEKTASYIGSLLTGHIPFSDQRGDAAFAAVYEQKLKKYEEEKESQKAEFSEQGYIAKYSVVK